MPKEAQSIHTIDTEVHVDLKPICQIQPRTVSRNGAQSKSTDLRVHLRMIEVQSGSGQRRNQILRTKA